MGKLRVGNGRVLAEHLVIDSREVASYLKQVGEPDRPAALALAAAVGVFCLDRAGTGARGDFLQILLAFAEPRGSTLGRQEVVPKVRCLAPEG